MNHPFSRRAFVAACAAASLVHPALAQTQGGTLRIVSPYGPGGTGDVLARSLGERLAPLLNVSVMVENKPGAGGSLGLAQVLKAPADGNTLALVATSPITILPHLLKVPYDPKKDLAAIAPVMISPVLVVATPAFKGKTLNDLIAQGRQKPGTVTFASPGQGTVGHLVIESISDTAKSKFVHVPYKTAGQLTTDAMAGFFDVLVTNPNSAMTQQIKAGKLRVLAVAAPTRLADHPNVPTLAEAGFKNAQLYSTYGVVGPRGLTADQRLVFNRAVNKALQSAEFKAVLLANDGQPGGGTSADYANALQAESEAAARIIKAANIRLD